MKQVENPAPGLVAIGRIRTSWGLKGWMKLSSFSGEWEHFAILKTVKLRNTQTGVLRQYEVEGFQMQQGGGMFLLSGINSPEAARMLSGREILVPKEFAAPLGTDEWYLSDLTGLTLVGADGRVFGTVISVVETSDDLLEIQPPEGAGSSFFVPFRSEFTGEPDLEAKTLLLKAPWLADSV